MKTAVVACRHGERIVPAAWTGRHLLVTESLDSPGLYVVTHFWTGRAVSGEFNGLSLEQALAIARDLDREELWQGYRGVKGIGSPEHEAICLAIRLVAEQWLKK